MNYVVKDSKPGSCKVTLNCSVALEDVTYEWLPPERVTSNRGGKLSVSFNPLVEVYTCVVRNRVSMNRSQLIYKHPCSWEGTKWDGWEGALAHRVPSNGDVASL